MALPVNEAQYPAVRYNRVQGFRGTAAVDIAAKTVVYPSGVSAAGRLIFSPASATNQAGGGRATLFIAMSGGLAGKAVDVVPVAVVEGALGGSAKDPVYLKDGGGPTLTAGEGTISRVIGHVLNASNWMFSDIGLVY
jgi:hypothetical protein